MVPVTLTQSDGVCLIRLEGEVNISCAAEMKKLLLQGLAAGTELRLDMERATDLDVTALQLLWAAEREAKRSGTAFTLVGSVPKEILAAVRDAGFENFPVAARPE